MKYHDTDLSIPEVDTLIFERVEMDDEGQKSWIFRFADASPDDEVQLCSFSADQLWQVLELPDLVKVLGELSRIAPYAPTSVTTATGLGENAATKLRAHIAEFLEKPQLPYLSVSIGYVNQALSIGRREGGELEMGFFPQPLRDDEDLRLLALFQDRGTKPHVDYLASRGRTRVLEFAVPADLKELDALSQRILKDIYRIRMDDKLEFTYGQF